MIHKIMNHHRIMSNRKHYEQQQTLWTTTKVANIMSQHKTMSHHKFLSNQELMNTTTTIINNHRHHEPPPKFRTITNILHHQKNYETWQRYNHHKGMSFKNISGIHNCDPSQKLWATTNTVLYCFIICVMAQDFCDVLSFLWWFFKTFLIVRDIFWCGSWFCDRP